VQSQCWEFEFVTGYIAKVAETGAPVKQLLGTLLIGATLLAPARQRRLRAEAT